MLKRHKTHKVKIGNITIGGNSPIAIQTMTNTPTEDIQATASQIIELTNAGAEIVRLTINNEKAAESIVKIKEILQKNNCNVPLVGDFHYNGHILLSKFKEMAALIDKYRINPGNVGFANKKDKQFEIIITEAIKHNKPVRIGVNWGSLDQIIAKNLIDANNKKTKPQPLNIILQNALIESALSSAKRAEEIGLNKNKIVISCKVSKVNELVAIYQKLAQKCNYPLHLGLTEAGIGEKAVIATSQAFAILLHQGIGDTIRASLTPKLSESRIKEIKTCQEILQSLALRKFKAEVTSCPGCGRTTSTYFQKLAEDIEEFIETDIKKLALKYKKAKNLNIAVMGCIVNGPGESKHADIGISLPGTGENNAAPVFIDGKKYCTLRGENITKEFKAIVINYIKENC
jgi:(E)-4-hydroxy-3-methylbut-2-enyl-diphosphate synthase